jgi:MFS family permease
LSWPIGRRNGRKGTLQVGAVIAIIGTTLQTAAQEVAMLIAGRIITGFAIGIIYFAIPQYQSELAPPEHRYVTALLAHSSIYGRPAHFI